MQRMIDKHSSSVPREEQPDQSCVPYQRRGLYFALTIAHFAVISMVLVYLWKISPLLSFALVGLYIATSYFQAYYCVYQDCPYVGGFCPAISGIYPANIIATRLKSTGIEKSDSMFQMYGTFAVISWFTMTFFPLYWLYLGGIEYAFAYFIFYLLYYLAFSLRICPSCAVRNTCPGGSLQRRIFGRHAQSE